MSDKKKTVTITVAGKVGTGKGRNCKGKPPLARTGSRKKQGAPRQSTQPQGRSVGRVQPKKHRIHPSAEQTERI